MVKLVNYSSLDNVVNQLKLIIGGARFTYKGQRYKLASPELIVTIGKKFQELMEEVELTPEELIMLLERHDLAAKLVGSLSLYVENGELPTQENVNIQGLAGLFFNATTYNAKINAARLLPTRQSEDQEYAPLAGAATLDILKPLRAKDVARLVHETIASEMELPAAQSLLVTLITDVEHPVAQQLRAEYGSQGLRSAPIAFLKSYVSSAQPAVTGDTKTWQNTVSALLRIVYDKYDRAKDGAFSIENVESRSAAIGRLQKSGGDLVRALTEAITSQEDAKFATSYKTERDLLTRLLDMSSERTARLGSDNNNTLMSESVLQLEAPGNNNNYNDDDDENDDRYRLVPSKASTSMHRSYLPHSSAAASSSMYSSYSHPSRNNEGRFMQERLVSESVTPYGELIRRVATLLEERLSVCAFEYKGTHFTLTTRAQRTRIREKCKELMAEVKLTDGEKQLLVLHGEPHTGNLRRLAELIVATIDLKQADGALPNKDNVTTSGLTGLFFNAMVYRPNVGVAFIKSAVTTADVDEDSDFIANGCTLDSMLPIRAKEVAHCVHVAMATVMNREQVQDLLIILRNQFVHPATEQLRVEYGMHGLRNPIDFASSFLNTEKVATGDTHTWQVTVLEVAEQARLKYVNEVAETNRLDKSDGAPQLAALATSSDALIAELEKKVPPCKDDAFAAKWEFKKGEFTALFYRVERSPVAANYKFD